MLVRDKDPRTLDRGKRPEERSVEELLSAGVIILDKVQGPTSHQVTAWVRDILGVEKIGKGDTHVRSGAALG
jgi:H/ACA ribonucleoprotein complex subunit 4